MQIASPPLTIDPEFLMVAPPMERPVMMESDLGRGFKNVVTRKKGKNNPVSYVRSRERFNDPSEPVGV